MSWELRVDPELCEWFVQPRREFLRNFGIFNHLMWFLISFNQNGISLSFSIDRNLAIP